MLLLPKSIATWWFQICFMFTLLGEIIQFDEHIFQMGWFNHQPDSLKFNVLLDAAIDLRLSHAFGHITGGGFL